MIFCECVFACKFVCMYGRVCVCVSTCLNLFIAHVCDKRKIAALPNFLT